jgi:hypothetical protein
LAKALEITTDELLGMKKSKTDFDTGNAAIRRKLRAVEDLPKKDQKAITHYIAMVAKNRELAPRKHKGS